ncbi:MAG: ATP-binding protein [Cyclobacteriaceae bacterium]
MIVRNSIAELVEIGDFMPVVGILGARQVGKTTLAKQFAGKIQRDCIYLDMEKPSDFQKLEEAELYFSVNQDKCIIIDEVQIKPELFPIIRAMVDEHRVPLRFVLLGSASPEIIRNTSESLAGRIEYLGLKPFSLLELPEIRLEKHHFFGGFPNSILAKTERQAERWIQGYIQTYVERDLPLLGLSASPMLVRRLWEMIAWQSGSLLNASAFGNSLGLTHHTINRYIDFLEGAFMINRLQPFYSNAKKRMVKSPKVYVADTGLLHGLMRLNSLDQLMGMQELGGSFETYVIQQLMIEKPRSLQMYFYRTHAGTEVDVVLTRGLKPVASLEIKYTSAPKVTKGFYNGVEDLGTKYNYIITPYSDHYPTKNGVEVYNVEEFLKERLPALGSE